MLIRTWLGLRSSIIQHAALFSIQSAIAVSSCADDGARVCVLVKGWWFKGEKRRCFPFMMHSINHEKTPSAYITAIPAAAFRGLPRCK